MASVQLCWDLTSLPCSNKPCTLLPLWQYAARRDIHQPGPVSEGQKDTSDQGSWIFGSGREGLQCCQIERDNMGHVILEKMKMDCPFLPTDSLPFSYNQRSCEIKLEPGSDRPKDLSFPLHNLSCSLLPEPHSSILHLPPPSCMPGCSHCHTAKAVAWNHVELSQKHCRKASGSLWRSCVSKFVLNCSREIKPVLRNVLLGTKSSPQWQGKWRKATLLSASCTTHWKSMESIGESSFSSPQPSTYWLNSPKLPAHFSGKRKNTPNITKPGTSWVSSCSCNLTRGFGCRFHARIERCKLLER